MTNRRTLLASAAFAPLLVSSHSTTGRVAQEATPETASGITVETDIVYGEAGGQDLVLDVYRPPARDAARPAVILVHGGAWTEGFADRTYLAGTAEELAKAGYVSFNISYRLMNDQPGHNVWPDQLDDVQRAVRWVRANAAMYGVDPDRLASLGHSAGGQLAAMMGVRETRDYSDPTAELYSSRVNCVVDLAGDMDLTLIYPAALDNEIARNLLGGTAEEEPDAYRDASPITWVNAETVPFLIVHSGSDDTNLVTHARTMADALHESSVDTVYVELGRGNHITPVLWEVSGPWILTFLAVYLRLDA